MRGQEVFQLDVTGHREIIVRHKTVPTIKRAGSLREGYNSHLGNSKDSLAFEGTIIIYRGNIEGRDHMYRRQLEGTMIFISRDYDDFIGDNRIRSPYARRDLTILSRRQHKRVTLEVSVCTNHVSSVRILSCHSLFY